MRGKGLAGGQSLACAKGWRDGGMKRRRTLKRLSWRTFLIAISSSSLGTLRRRAANTTPKEPLPMTLQFVYEISFWSPVLPSEATTLIILVGSSTDRRGVGGIEARGGGGATRGG